MLRSCKDCGRIHDTKFDCGCKPKRIKKGNTTAEQVRNSYRWRKTREAINDRDGNVCRWCLKMGKVVWGDLETHHIIPIEECKDLAYEDNNLITLCVRCHKLADQKMISRGELEALTDTPPTLSRVF